MALFLPRKFIQRPFCMSTTRTTLNFTIRNAWRFKFRVSIAASFSSQGLVDSPSQFRMRLALPADRERVMNFMRRTYFKTEPSLVNIGIARNINDQQEPPTALIHLMHQHLNEGMTIIAEGTDNCVIGVAVNAGCCPWDPDRIVEYAECCCERGPIRDLIKFYAYITNQPKLWDKFSVVKIFECCYVSVDPCYLGMGIGRQLVEESWYLARDCGYQVFRIDCTSVYTSKIAEGFGWECVFSMPYKKYIDCGGLVFKNIREPHTEVRVFADRPLICKDYCPTNPPNCNISTIPYTKKYRNQSKKK